MYPGLVSCPFYAIPIYPFKFMKFFIYLYIYRQTDRQTDRQTGGALNSQGGAHSLTDRQGAR